MWVGLRVRMGFSQTYVADCVFFDIDAEFEEAFCARLSRDGNGPVANLGGVGLDDNGFVEAEDLFILVVVVVPFVGPFLLVSAVVTMAPGWACYGGSSNDSREGCVEKMHSYFKGV
jgi:hypothetical protein